MATPQPHNVSTAQNPVGRFMVASGGVIQLTGTDKILVIQRSAAQDWHANEWEILYGRIDQHESPEEGLRREVKEEIGLLELEIGQVLRVWHMYRGTEKTAENDLVGITYHCTTTQENIQLSHEHQSFQWVTPAEALELVQIEGIRTDILTFLEKQKVQ